MAGNDKPKGPGRFFRNLAQKFRRQPRGGDPTSADHHPDYYPDNSASRRLYQDDASTTAYSRHSSDAKHDNQNYYDGERSEHSASSQQQYSQFEEEDGHPNSHRGYSNQLDDFTTNSVNLLDKTSLWWEHSLFFMGALIAFIAAAVELSHSKWWHDLVSGNKYSNNNQDDDEEVMVKAVVGPWGWFTFLQAIAAVFFSAHAVVHFCVTPAHLDKGTRRCGMVFFGLAAAFFLASCMLEVQDQQSGEWKYDRAYDLTYSAAIHLFLASAFCYVVKDFPYVPSFCFERIHVQLIVIGDYLFFFATIIVVCLYWTEADDESVHHWLVDARYQMVAATLWLVDAIFYLISVYMIPSSY